MAPNQGSEPVPREPSGTVGADRGGGEESEIGGAVKVATQPGAPVPPRDRPVEPVRRASKRDHGRQTGGVASRGGQGRD